jgi:hypothetical protein
VGAGGLLPRAAIDRMIPAREESGSAI